MPPADGKAKEKEKDKDKKDKKAAAAAPVNSATAAKPSKQSSPERAGASKPPKEAAPAAIPPAKQTIKRPAEEEPVLRDTPGNSPTLDAEQNSPPPPPPPQPSSDLSPAPPAISTYPDLPLPPEMLKDAAAQQQQQQQQQQLQQAPPEVAPPAQQPARAVPTVQDASLSGATGVSKSQLSAQPSAPVARANPPSLKAATTAVVAGLEIRRRWRERLAEYASIRAPTMTDAEMDAALEFYEKHDDGYNKMWSALLRRFGADLTPSERERVKWAKKLRAFYALVDPAKTDRDVDECLNHFEKKQNGFEEMWLRLQKRYNVNIGTDGLPAPHAKPVAVARHASPVVLAQQRQSQSPQRPAEMADDPVPSKVILIVVVAGISMKLYRNVGPAQQYAFNSCVAAEIQGLLRYPDHLFVTNVLDHVDGMLFEFEANLPPGHSSQSVGSTLVRKVMSGDCSVAIIRQAYAEQLLGNPQRIYLMDAGMIEYRTTPGLKTTLRISGSGGSGGAGAVVSTAANVAPQPSRQDPYALRSVAGADVAAPSPFKVAPLGLGTFGRGGVSPTRASSPPLPHHAMLGSPDSTAFHRPYEPPLLMSHTSGARVGAMEPAPRQSQHNPLPLPGSFAASSPFGRAARPADRFSSPYDRAVAGALPSFEMVDSVDDYRLRQPTTPPVAAASPAGGAFSPFSSDRQALRGSLEVHMRRNGF